MATRSIDAQDHRRDRRDGSPPDIHIYPVGEHHPMPSYAHERAMFLIKQVLISLLAPTHLVADELAVLWDPVNYRRHLVPDLMVVLDVGELDPVYGVYRNQYRVWDEGKPPDLVLEAASPTTYGRDSVGKKEDYARFGVREYVQFDPLGELLQPGLQVYQLRGDRFEPAVLDPSGVVASEVLTAYEWVQFGPWLRLRERASGTIVPTPDESLRETKATLSETTATLSETMATLQGTSETLRETTMELEQTSATLRDAEAARVREAARAAEAEAEVARLRALLAELQRGGQ